MSKLIDFLSLPDVSSLTETVEIPQLGGHVEIKAFTRDQIAAYRRRCTTYGKKGARDVDSEKLQNIVIANHMTSPNINSADYLASAGAQTAEELISKKIPPGIVDDIYAAICTLSGYDADGEPLKEAIEEAKN